MNGLSFFVACVPPKVSHHHKKIIKRGGFYSMGDRPELQAAKGSLDAWFLPYQPAQPLTGAVVLDIELTWPWLKGDSKKVRALGRIPHDSKPDWDNAAKGIADCLARLRFIEHDSRIVDGRVRKWRGDAPGIRVRISPVVVGAPGGVVGRSAGMACGSGPVPAATCGPSNAPHHQERQALSTLF